jgi:hypothetical protein
MSLSSSVVCLSQVPLLDMSRYHKLLAVRKTPLLRAILH